MNSVLVLDIGNTRSKWAVLDSLHGTPVEHGLFSNSGPFDKNFLDNIAGAQMVYCSVAAMPEFISQALSSAGSVLELKHDSPIPIEINYATPHTIGLDRVANAVAASKLFPEKNVLVIDAGTCITFDLIDSKAVYQGGSIAPGLTMRAKALNNYTDALPLVSLVKPEQLVGKSTEKSILSGVVNGAIAEIAGIVARYEPEYKCLQVVLTGGDLKWFEHDLKNETFADAFFTLRGLYAIHEFNRN